MTHTRPTISLGMICKNEERHMDRVLNQVIDLFDEIVVVDTGSTDKTLEILEKWKEKYDHLKYDHFEWVNDFGKARQYCFDMCTMDYAMWLDLDDEIVNPEEFIKFRNNTMHSADYWLINYNYTQDKDGKSVCNFVRERVVKNDGRFHWRYPIHEGLVPVDETKKVWSQRCLTWEIKHVRTEDDIAADRSRNINLFEAMEKKDELDMRLTFYYGKELFDVGRHKEASKYLMKACQDKETAFPERIMALQYCAQSALMCEAYEQAEQLALNGVQLMPQRAEFWCTLGDARIKRGDLRGAIVYFNAARACDHTASNIQGMIFSLESSYNDYPTTQIINCHANLGEIDLAKAELNNLLDPRIVEQTLPQIEKMEKLNTLNPDAKEIDEIVISTPPNSAVTEWDEEGLKTRGFGGSETAAIEVAKYLKLKHGISVKIFNERKEYLMAESGVEYVPLQELGNYFQRYKPRLHIAWRHSVKLSHAPMFTWCHDLQCAGGERQEFDKILALSPFHKEYLATTQGIDRDKITLFRNGIDPKLWESEAPEKNKYKVIFSSSPDRGLERCIDIVKKAREKSGLPIELHLFYGVDNMRKMGANDWADKIMKKVWDNKDFVHYHGNVDKPTLIKHFRESAVWLYPADFIETYCITVLEALASGAYPMVRRVGALPDTISSAAPQEMYWITDRNCENESDIEYWADNLQKAILDEKWKEVKLETARHSWENVAQDLLDISKDEGIKFGSTD